MKKFLVLLLIATLYFSTVAYAEDVEGVTLDGAGVKLDGSFIVEKSNPYVRENGISVPSSILYKGTTYMPLKLIAQLLGLTVGWDSETSSVLLTSPSGRPPVDHATTPSSVKVTNINYSDSIQLPISGVTNLRKAFVEDAYGNEVEVPVSINGGVATLTETYFLGLGQSYTLAVVSGNEVVSVPFRVNDQITLDSFSDVNGTHQVVIPASPKDGFYHPFVLTIQTNGGRKTLSEHLMSAPNTMLAEGSNEFVTNSNKESYAKAIREVNWYYSSNIARETNHITLVSMFPRPNQDGLLYTHSLDRDTLFRSKYYLDNLGRGNLERIDIQFKKSIEYGQKVLAGIGKTVDQKVFLVGFSASADFASRMNYLHPDLAKAVSVNASPTLPYTEYQGVKMRWPLGMADLQELTGSAFDPDQYRTVPQFWHTGDQDDNDGTYFDDGWGDYQGESRNQNQEGMDYRKLFGNEIVARKRLITALVAKDFPNVISKEYAGVEHGWNDEIMQDVINFLKANE